MSATAFPVKSSVKVGDTSVTSNIVAIPVVVQEPSPTSEVTNPSEPAFPPGLSKDDAYWRHLRDMWDANSNDPNSRRPSETSPISPSFSDDASVVDLEDVDLRSATAQYTFRLSNLPTLIKSQTDEANKPQTLDVPGAHALPTPRSFAGRRTFNGVIVTTRSTTRIGFHDPAPPYTPRASMRERSFGVDGYAVDQKEVSQINKWTYWIPSCKWLFWIGFIFPLFFGLSVASLSSSVCISHPQVRLRTAQPKCLSSSTKPKLMKSTGSKTRNVGQSVVHGRSPLCAVWSP